MHASASTHPHGFVSTEPKSWSSILTFEMRSDGFTFASSAGGGGGGGNSTFMTKPLLWQGGEVS